MTSIVVSFENRTLVEYYEKDEPRVLQGISLGPSLSFEKFIESMQQRYGDVFKDQVFKLVGKGDFSYSYQSELVKIHLFINRDERIKTAVVWL